MRIHHLRITGLGPYAGTEEIDFDPLNSAGVLLLSGPTGSGKTTILDAVCFALFGEIPRSASGSEVVSDHRKPGTTPEAVLEFTVAGSRLKVTRRPEHLRPKVHNPDETTSEKQFVLLEREVADAWQTESEGWTETNERLRGLIGMDANQFHQLVLLPQGKFARFLESKSRERKELLETLFPNNDLTYVEDWLKKRRSADSKARDEKLQQILNCLEQARPDFNTLAAELAAEGADPLPEIPEGHEPEPVVGWAAAVTGRLKERVASASKRRDESLKSSSEAEASLAEAGRRRALVEQRIEAEKSLEELESRSSWRDELEKRNESAEKAGSVATLIEQLKTNERTASEAEVESEKLASGLLAEELVATDDVKELKAKQASFSETITTIGNFESDGQERRRELDRLLPAAESALEELEQGGPDTELAKAEAAAKSAEQSRREAREALLEIRRLRTAGMAAELAEGLEDGSPCPVCGSTEHPGMDHSTAPSVSKEDEEAADRKDGQAEQRAADAAARRDAVKTAEAERKAEIRKEVLHLTAERDRLVAKESELAAGEATPTARREKLESVVEQIGAYLESTGLAAERRSSADASRKTALAQAEACGFDGLEAAEAAAIDAGELERGKAQVAEYDEALNKAKGLLGGELSKVDPDEVVDLRPLEAAAEAAITRRDHDTGVLATARERLGTFSESTDPIQGLFEELEPLRTAAARSNELSRLASGDNEMRIRLSTYVLAVRLKQVIQAANVHLQKMSNGRYELVYSGDVAAHGAASGLDIGIYDSHTSASRSTGTLSGGESFYASLSLALGLAEVVQQETGGKRLETLFIDEGFGTLDSKTLDQVMDVIDDLREGGRTVGLVSHVDELRNRVTARIEVSATRDGSTIDVVGV